MGVDFADYVLQRRLDLGLTQQDLARLAGLRETTIAQIEDAQGWPMPQVIGALAEALQLDAGDLVQRAEAEQWGTLAPEWSLYDPELAVDLGGDYRAPEVIGRVQFRELVRQRRQAAQHKARSEGPTRRSGEAMPGKPSFAKRKAG